MLVNRLKIALIATAGLGALSLGVNPAGATALPFGVNPNVLTAGGYANSNVAADTISGSSDSLIRQLSTSPAVQQEVGWVQGTELEYLGLTVDPTVSGMLKESGITGNFYNLYLLFEGTVNGLVGFGAGSGNIAAGGYSYALFADIGRDDIFAAGANGPSGGTVPKVTGNTGNDKLIALGTATDGVAGFTGGSANPAFFTVTASFILCHAAGVGNGSLGGVDVAPGTAQVTLADYNGGAAIKCGGFEGSSYFVNPNPFYTFDFNSAIPSAASALTPDIADGTATLNSTQASITFVSTPEPASVALFGMGLLGLGFMFRRRNERAANA
jgi:hypothetical protein